VSQALIVSKETNSNWPTIFALPDYLHRTCRLTVSHEELTIVPEFRDPDDLGLVEIIAMPFGGEPTGAVHGRARHSLPAEPFPCTMGGCCPDH